MPKKQEEAIFRTALIKHLKKHHCKVFRVEPPFRGKFGLGDLWVSCRGTKWAGWVETKSLKGRLSDDQIEFQADCLMFEVKYIVAKRVEDIDEIIPPSYSSKYNHIDDFYRKHPELKKQ